MIKGARTVRGRAYSPRRRFCPMLSTATRVGLPTARHRLLRPALRSLSNTSQPLRSTAPANRTPIPSFSGLSSTSARAMSSSHGGESTLRPEPDKVLQDIADYVHNYKIDSPLAFETARLCLIDTIGCGLEALRFPECTKLLGPVVEGTVVPNGKHHTYYSGFFLTICRYPCPRYQLHPRPRPGRVQYWNHYPMARFQ